VIVVCRLSICHMGAACGSTLPTLLAEYRDRDQDGTFANFGDDLGHADRIAGSPCVRHSVVLESILISSDGAKGGLNG
jgi:hypothetical protein